MKQKDQWARDYAEREFPDDMENDRGIAWQAWIAGFDEAKRICGKHLGEWESVNNNSFDFVGEGELLTK